MSLKRSIGLAVFVAVALLVSRVPASVIGSILPQTLTASGFTGTVWRGEAAHVQAEVQGQPFALGRVAWTVHPLGLLAGAIRRRWNRGTLHGRACRHRGTTGGIKCTSA